MNCTHLLQAALLAAVSAASVQAAELDFGLLGIVPGQTAQLNAVTVTGETGDPCLLELYYLDRKGQVIKALPAVQLEPNQSVSFKLDASGIVDTIERRRGIRPLIKAVGNADGLSDCSVAATLEVFDSVTGRIDLVLYPGMIRGFNPQPDPPKTRN
ncbi:hypothetical protein NP590_16505 [Methylomonas sp. SURF-2]|uniref:Tat pathway signal sequence domain protein n=1 Tax=Methylomonas subterranea TaxID=2952225 RepID=A0ABT1TJS5_9GAMM|nr:hypothetical protein [Methylomonas sp. SURF-2]MCQ8105715.1 hypothetical protein [Methylomonas sp. SURF-2]